MKKPSFGAPYPFAKVVQSMQGKSTGERKNRVKKTEESQLQSSFAILEHFPKSFFYILYTISKLTFLYSVVDFLLKLPDICRKLEVENLKVEANFAALLSVCEISQTPFFTCEMVLSASRYFQPNSEDFSSENERLSFLSLGVRKAGCACHIEYEIAEEAMNFMSYVAEVSREWDEPNARDKERMTSQPKAKGEMYILNDGMDMKAEIAAMERRLDELEMNQMQEVQAISKHHCYLCFVPFVYLMSTWLKSVLSFQWRGKCLVIATPTIPIGGNIQISLGNHSHLSITNLLKHHTKPQTLNKLWMDEIQNDMAQKLDILQDSISRLANLNIVQEKENSPSQPYQNSMSIHEMEAEEGEPSQKREVKEVITLRSGKEVDLPTCKLEHKVESETEKEKREEIKGKKKGKNIEKDGYVQREPRRIVIKEELMKKHMPPPFLQALYGKIIQTKSQLKDANFIWDPGKLNQEQIFDGLSFWMIKIKRNCKEIEGSLSEQNRSKIGVKRSENRGKTEVCEISQPLRNQHFAAKPVRSLRPLFAKIFATVNQVWHTSATSQHSGPHFAATKAAANHQSMKSSISQGKIHLEGCFTAAKANLAHECHFAVQEYLFRSCETHCEVVKPDFAPKVHSAGYFTITKAILAHKCHFAAQ
ncbi:hypothetical protein CK203_070215 [Vitis vinifera]|uniref:Uncharacterized protein n=1 Tax=Vitis vinifera TaxID=29760 RepID=A0A438EHD9_VITVI|nr:hypothetical protein CK203_070215 [Vitis vinifera]